MEKGHGGPPGWCIPHHARLPPAHVQFPSRRKHHLHGLGPFQGSLAAEGTLVTAKHGLIGLAKTVAKEGAKHGVRANVICPGFVRTPLVDKQIPEQATELGISEQEVVKNVMLKDTVDDEFTTVADVAEAALFFAAFGSNALTGQSLVVSHGWFMQ